MPSHRQLMTEVPVTDRGFGSSDTNTLRSAFPASPIHAGDAMGDDDIKARAQSGDHSLLDGVVNDSGHTYGEFDRDYSNNGAPDFSEVKTGGGGLPATPYVPNPASPEDGFDYTTIPDPPDGFMEKDVNTWGSGVGGTVSPSETSAKLAGHTIGEYLGGDSGATEAGGYVTV